MARQSILLLSGSPGWPDRVRTWADAFDVESCTAAEEVRALLTGSRPWALVLIDGSEPDADRDLIALVVRAGARAVVVDSSRGAVEWRRLGAHDILPPDFGRPELMAALRSEAEVHSSIPATAPLVAVTGPGGTGASTIAIALSQGLVADRRRVVLADFCRHAELHVLHHLEPDCPGVGELVEAHRTSSPDPVVLNELPTQVPRGYQVLPGLRRAVGWSSLRPRALDAAVETLRAAFDVVVCDTDADLEGEAEGGSVDVEERNALARVAVAHSSAVVVVGGPGAKGAHSLLRVLGEMWSHEVPPERTVAVLNRSDADSLARLTAALGQLGAAGTAALILPGLPLESLLLTGGALPESLVTPITASVLPLLGAGVPRHGPAPARIVPGTLGLTRPGDVDV